MFHRRRYRFSLRFGLLSLAAAATVLFLAAGAQASSLAGRGPGIPTSKCSSSGNSCFAGYAVNIPSGTKSASVHFVVSALTCGTTKRLVLPSIIVGNSTETHYVIGGVSEQCVSGKRHYVPLAQAGSKATAINQPVKAGDHVSVSASASASGAAVTVKDSTESWSATVKSAGFSPAFADFGMDWQYNATTGVVYGVPRFGTAAFTSALVGTKALGTLNPERFNRTISGTRDITTGAFNTAKTRFTATFVHS